jgi:hypothetical protein
MLNFTLNSIAGAVIFCENFYRKNLKLRYCRKIKKRLALPNYENKKHFFILNADIFWH